MLGYNYYSFIVDGAFTKEDMMKKSLFPLFILIVIVFFLGVAPNCTRTVTEYEIDTVEAEPTMALFNVRHFYNDNDPDHNTVLVQAIVRNISDKEIPNPHIGILVYHNNDLYYSFVQGVAENLSVLLNKDTSYVEMTVLKPKEKGYMFFKFPRPGWMDPWVFCLPLSGDKLPTNLPKPSALATLAVKSEKPLILESE